MAEGRLLKKSIADDGRVAQLSPDAQHLFVRAIPFQDNEGRMPGDPGAVRDLVVPLLPWSDDTVDQLIAEWESTVHEELGVLSPLVVRYHVDPSRRWRDREARKEFECRLALQFAGFKNQPGRLRRGASTSMLPAPPGDWPTGPLAHTTTGPLAHPGHSVSARARGSRGPNQEELSKDQHQAAAARERPGELPDDLNWFASRFVDVFGRTPSPPTPDQARKLRELLTVVGRDQANALLSERAHQPIRSLAYFSGALAERAVVPVHQTIEEALTSGTDLGAYTRA